LGKGSDLIRVRLDVPSPAIAAGLRLLLSDDAQIQLVASTDIEDRPGDGADVLITTHAPSELHSGMAPRPDTRAAMLFLGDRQLDVGRLTSDSLVWGALPLDASAEELGAAIRALSAGLVVASAQLLAISGTGTPTEGPLTEREAEVLGLLSKGLANKQIALELGISEHTVKFHVSSVYAKLNASSRTQAVREGLRLGLIIL
jgi:DNA-binding NarL/FixJ family response regulator